MPLNFRILAGLGNPTPKYEKTRHNAGFWFLDQVAARYRLEFRQDRRFRGAIAKIDVGGDPVYLLKPETFMNCSGESVGALLQFLKLQADQVLVVHDDLDLLPGMVRLKCGGGHGGHNGLRNLISHFGSAAFYRLRFGIGHPGDRAAVVRYVLGIPPRTEEDLIQCAMERAISLVPEFLAGRLDTAVQQLHSAESIGKKIN